MGRLSRLGALALIALIVSAIGAAGSQAATPQKQWKIGGASFSGEETFSLAGSIKFVTPTKIGSTAECSASGSGTIAKNSLGTARIHLTGCVFPQAPRCSFNGGSAELWANTELIVVETAPGIQKLFQKFSPMYGETFLREAFSISGEECPFTSSSSLRGTFAASPGGNEAVSYPLSLSKTVSQEAKTNALLIGNSPVFVEGALTETLTGAQAGLKWGAK